VLNCKATLRVKSEQLNLEDISDVLGPPTSGFSKGDEYGKAKQLRKHTQWSFVACGEDNSPLQQHILTLLNFLSEKEIASIRQKCDVDIFCMLSSNNGQGSFTIDRTIYEKLLTAGLPITFDFYAD